MYLAYNTAEMNPSGKVGSYAVNTISFDSWNKEPIVKQRAKRNNVVNENFEKVYSLVKDPFWSEKLRQASIGKFPRGFSYRDDTLFYEKTQSNVCLKDMQGAHLTECFIAFFKRNASMFSPMDLREIEEIKAATERKSIPPEPLIWVKCNKKMQECILTSYISEKSRELSLSRQQVQNFKETIGLGISNKLIENSDISMEDQRIKEIRGLLYDANSKRFYIDPSRKCFVKTKKEKLGEVITVKQKDKEFMPQFLSKWEIYSQRIADKKGKPFAVDSVTTTMTSTTTDD